MIWYQYDLLSETVFLLISFQNSFLFISCLTPDSGGKLLIWPSWLPGHVSMSNVPCQGALWMACWFSFAFLLGLLALMLLGLFGPSYPFPTICLGFLSIRTTRAAEDSLGRWCMKLSSCFKLSKEAHMSAVLFTQRIQFFNWPRPRPSNRVQVLLLFGSLLAINKPPGFIYPLMLLGGWFLVDVFLSSISMQ